MSGLSKERIQYLQKVAKKEVVKCPPEKKNIKKRRGRYWYLDRQEFNDWNRWMKYIDKTNEENVPRSPKIDYWDPPEHNDMVVVMAEEVVVLDCLINS